MSNWGRRLSDSLITCCNSPERQLENDGDDNLEEISLHELPDEAELSELPSPSAIRSSERRAFAAGKERSSQCVSTSSISTPSGYVAEVEEELPQPLPQQPVI